nr:uncharacterized protein I303_01982 [Kwoniella dejecticola CBS 10117]OBR87770.1 hypothetical protein I303_01982 [Kwoniella dejecticola CBS 10117]
MPVQFQPAARYIASASSAAKQLRKLAKAPTVRSRRCLSSATRAFPDVSTWTDSGIARPLAEALLTAYPHIVRPTQAQKLFLLAVGAGKEVYLKDDMGRGKTLALALSASNIALKSKTQGGPRVMILVPTPYLAHQIHSHLMKLSPSSSLSGEFANPSFTLLAPILPGRDSSPTIRDVPDTPIIISTPKDLLAYDHSNLNSLKHIFLDEPDTMIGSIPSRHSTPNMLAHHTLFKHPPPIIRVLNNLLNIRPASDGEGSLDYSRRRDDINTIWISSSLNKDFKRLVKTRGWIKRSNSHLVDLDFTQGASDKLKAIRTHLLNALEMKISAQSEYADSQTADTSMPSKHRKPEHYALLVDPQNGSISTLDPSEPSTYIPPNRKTGQDDAENREIRQVSENEKRGVPVEMLEALSIIHLSSPPPQGKYALVLPPEGISLNALSEELSELGLSSSILQPELIHLESDSIFLAEIQSGSDPEDGQGELPILIARRSSITGLHLRDLHTIYLLDGLDFQGLTKNKRQAGGVKDRMKFYELVTGRLGRLGTSDDDSTAKPTTAENKPTPDASHMKQRQRQRQRVISLVMDGTEDEKRLKEMFGHVVEGGQQWNLKAWDVEGMNRLLEEQMGISEEVSELNAEEDGDGNGNGIRSQSFGGDGVPEAKFGDEVQHRGSDQAAKGFKTARLESAGLKEEQ